MTLIDAGTEPGLAADGGIAPRHHPHRWRMNRAGLVDVWYYYDTEFDFAGGRLILRGTNGSGKSRALELLLPYVLDADRRKMDATGSGKVSLVELMKAGGNDRTTRVGYLWLELARNVDPTDPVDTDLHNRGVEEQFLTVGVHIRYSRSTGEAKPHYFTTDLRVGIDLELLSPSRETLPREKLTELIGADRITPSPSAHRDRVRAAVFTLTGDSGSERYAGLLQLLHTLRAPDVGNRIDEGKLPQILSDALPPLSETALNAAGEQLDGLSETRAAQIRLEAALEHLNSFFSTYRRYAATVIADSVTGALAAAAAAESAHATAESWRHTHEALERDHGETKALTTELEETIEELEATISGIKVSAAYAGARDLDDREQKVTAFGSAADNALRTASMARSAEERAVATADDAARHAADRAVHVANLLQLARTRTQESGTSDSLPPTVEAMATEEPSVADSVRVTRIEDVRAVARPVAKSLKVQPADLDSTKGQVARVEAGLNERHRQAGSRLVTARGVQRQHDDVKGAEATAHTAEERVLEAEQAESQHELELDEASVAYGRGWTEWTADSDTVKAFGGPPDLSATELGPVVADPVGRLADLDDHALAELDQTALGLAARAGRPHHAILAALDVADLEAEAERSSLLREKDKLLAMVDPSPAGPPWLKQDAADATPLWRAVDFASGLSSTERAGLEGALIGSGLLLATVHTDGALRAENGQLIVTPRGTEEVQSVLGTLVTDPASPVAANVVDSVLKRIGLRTPESSAVAGMSATGVWIATDGSWGTGPLTGRFIPSTAQHIGATAREHTRRLRLEAIEGELADIADAESRRTSERAEAEAVLMLIESTTRAAPGTQAVARARVRVQQAAILVAKERSAARSASEVAARKRTAWVSALAEHRLICSEFNLPETIEELDAVRRVAKDAVSACEQLRHGIAELARAVNAHGSALVQVEDRAHERADAERLADADWKVWHRAASELEATRATIGQEAADAKRELYESEKSRDARQRELVGARENVARLADETGAARVEHRNAAAQVNQRQEELVGAVNNLRRRLALPGLAAAAFKDAPPPFELAEITPADVRKATNGLATRLTPPSQRVDENTLTRPRQNLERELSGTYDVLPETRDGVQLFELSDATGRSTVAQAVSDLSRTVEKGRTALSERERTVFTEFVLGGVAEELRRRLGQAEQLVDAMNTSLVTIQTSHGIGVKLRWRTAESSDPTIIRLKALVATAGAVRSSEQSSELAGLLKTRVDQAYALDESAGYATHLRNALDYRSWHQVEVIIMGPAPGQERRISRKARLSQGEIRFVSYVTLFAAIDAYLTGLPDTNRALRLLLLDDAFAKVDDRTIGELMGLLVRLDVDFAMTGHSLWGTYPQVPALDCYEVRRVEGSAAVTTHIHWDGHTKHLRAAR